MRVYQYLPICLLAASPAPAAAEAFACRGDAPSWMLDFDAGGLARFNLLGSTEMEVMHETAAEGRDWPRAFTLVGDRDTAIVLVEPGACGTLDYRARVLTQRGQTPILLAGCCERRE